jgi:hypothetical protein
MEIGCSLCGPVLDVICKGQGYLRVSVYGSLAREPEESPVLESVTRERLVKIARYKMLSGCCGELWRLAVEL